jgi:DNA-binding MarR family transcriptional regulator
VIGQAENAHLAILNRALAASGVTRDQWVALSVAMAAGGPIGYDTLTSQVADALKQGPEAAQTAIAGLISNALLEGAIDQRGDLIVSESGQAFFQSVREANSKVIARAYAEIPAEDLATAARVLTTITARLSKELAEG